MRSESDEREKEKQRQKQKEKQHKLAEHAQRPVGNYKQFLLLFN